MTTIGDRATFLFTLAVLAWLLTDSIGGML